ncbi:flavin reductase family protein [Kiloniella laminariae]|uniref:Flavin reductase family protein n=1 Tax=Kiloniella laminariae TaxID=454162 RepID=A0ABT4LGC4_9PROT|nr:flavin reductase family protein [Kiloniella laminariae]MCZ4280158.1 flavin reductase family protein [Kiloniella laminariae]
MAFDTVEFRKALGNFATGVTVVTTRDKAGIPHGLTANSFSSVSLDPPLVLFCIDKRSNCLPAFEEGDAFAINVLSDKQQDISNRFAFAEERWDGVKTTTLQTGVPILAGCLANLDCSMHARFDAGDHIIVVGKVEQLLLGTEGNPLLYFKGKYRGVEIE